MPYFALIIMYYHVKIACYQISTESLVNKEFNKIKINDLDLRSGRNPCKKSEKIRNQIWEK